MEGTSRTAFLAKYLLRSVSILEAAVTNYHTFNGFKQHDFILLSF